MSRYYHLHLRYLNFLLSGSLISNPFWFSPLHFTNLFSFYEHPKFRSSRRNSIATIFHLNILEIFVKLALIRSPKAFTKIIWKAEATTAAAATTVHFLAHSHQINFSAVYIVRTRPRNNFLVKFVFVNRNKSIRSRMAVLMCEMVNEEEKCWKILRSAAELSFKFIMLWLTLGLMGLVIYRLLILNFILDKANAEFLTCMPHKSKRL